jgi:hypothetical protein
MKIMSNEPNEDLRNFSELEPQEGQKIDGIKSVVDVVIAVQSEIDDVLIRVDKNIFLLECLLKEFDEYGDTELLDRKIQDFQKLDRAMVLEFLIRSLRGHNNHCVQKNAVYVLTKIDDPKVVEILIKALDDRDATLRANAAESLGIIGDSRALKPLIRASYDSSSSLVRINAVIALGKIGDPTLRNHYLAMALWDTNSLVRMSAALELRQLGAVRAIDEFIRFMLHESERMRSCALDALIEVLGDESQFARYEAAQKFGMTMKSELKSLFQNLEGVNPFLEIGNWDQEFLGSCVSLNFPQTGSGEVFVNELMKSMNQVLYEKNEGDKSENPLLNMKNANAILAYWCDFLELTKEAEVNSEIVALKNLLQSSPSFQEVIRNIEDRIKFLEGFAVAADETLFQ